MLSKCFYIITMARWESWSPKIIFIWHFISIHGNHTFIRPFFGEEVWGWGILFGSFMMTDFDTLKKCAINKCQREKMKFNPDWNTFRGFDIHGYACLIDVYVNTFYVTYFVCVRSFFSMVSFIHIDAHRHWCEEVAPWQFREHNWEMRNKIL